MTPQPYNRLYQLTGVKGFANKYPTEGYALGADQLSASGVQPRWTISAHTDSCHKLKWMLWLRNTSTLF